MRQVTVELENHIADKLKSLIQFFGGKDLLFDSFIEFHRKKIKREIAHLQVDLNKYEAKYTMSTSAFYDKFEVGELEDSKDFMVWAGIYEMLKSSKEKLAQIS